MKLREYFFVRKENKNNNFIQQFFSSLLVFNVCSREYRDKFSFLREISL